MPDLCLRMPYWAYHHQEKPGLYKRLLRMHNLRRVPANTTEQGLGRKERELYTPDRHSSAADVGSGASAEREQEVDDAHDH